jgi:hypothetical protein
MSKKVNKMTCRTLDREVSEIAGRSANWSIDLTATIKLAEDLDIIKHPRYIARTEKDNWIVREYSVKNSLSRGDTLAIAVCRAIIIVTKGKGRYYSSNQETTCTSKSF